MSPDGKIMVDFKLDEKGRPVYDVEFAGSLVIQGNKLGIIRNDADFSENLKTVSVSESEVVTDNYTMLYGKQKDIAYKANRKIYKLRNQDKKEMDIVFQVSDDGFGFRYVFPEESDKKYIIDDEITTFQFDANTLTWIQPMSEAKTGWNAVNPCYEEHYFIAAKLDSLPYHKPGWVYPALFKQGNYWISITESAPDRNYCGTRLILNKNKYFFKIGFPYPSEKKDDGPVNPKSSLPWSSPWRIVSLSDNPGTLVESTLGTDLANSSVISDISFVKPGRSSWSWVLYKDDSTVYPVQKGFIDYAAEMGWEYCLIDADWDRKIGYEKIEELVQYAKSKDVGIVLWYNSAGDWNTTPYSPRNKMLTASLREVEFKKLSNLGVKGVKIDFFGGDGQSMMSYYQDILETAARYKIMVNCHGATLPRGWQRTYPNLVSMEAIKGMEYVTFEQINADFQAQHCTVLPFTRNLFDPMDFTPVCFSEIPLITRKTTNSFELALAVLFLSGVQHYAEVPEGMAKVPAEIKQLMKEIPVDWDETRFIDGYPGDFVVIARRKGNDWYIAGINGSLDFKSISIDLSFLDTAKEVTFVTDGENNRTFNIVKDNVDFGQNIDISMQPNGGFLFKVSV